jgi:hypothetical protein
MMQVQGFSGYTGGLSKLLADRRVPSTVYQRKAFKRGVLHIAGAKNSAIRQYEYTKFVNPIVKHAVENGASRLVYVIAEASQVRKIPCAAIVGDVDDVIEWVNRLSAEKPNLGLYFYAKDPMKMIADADHPVRAFMDFDGVSEDNIGFEGSFNEIQTAIDIVNDMFILSMDVQDIDASRFPLDVSICYNNRLTPAGKEKNSYHVTWKHHGFKSQSDQKMFMKSSIKGACKNMDMSVYSNGRLMRMPMCGKQGEGNAKLAPITVTYVDGIFTKVWDGNDVISADTFHSFNICPYTWEDGEKYLFHSVDEHNEVRRTVMQSGAVTQQMHTRGLSGPIYEMFKPLFERCIIPRIQAHRAKLRAAIPVHSESGVPTTFIEISAIKAHDTMPGVFTTSVINDTFCQYDNGGLTPYFHKTRRTTLQLDMTRGLCFVKCFCRQNNFAKYSLFGFNDICVQDCNEFSMDTLQLNKDGVVEFYLQYWKDDIMYQPAICTDFYIFNSKLKMWVHDDNLLTTKKSELLNRYRAYRLQVYDISVQRRIEYINNTDGTEEQRLRSLDKLKKERVFLQTINPFTAGPDTLRREMLTSYHNVHGAYSTMKMDIHPHVVPMNDGTCFDVLSATCVPMTKDMNITSCLNARMKTADDDECVVVRKWFLEVARGRPDLAKYMMLVTALVWTMLKIDRKFYCNLGVEGRNGKSVYFEILQVNTHTHIYGL